MQESFFKHSQKNDKIYHNESMTSTKIRNSNQITIFNFLTIFPLTFGLPSVFGKHGSFPMLLVIFPKSFIPTSICIRVDAKPIFGIILPFSLIFTPIEVNGNSIPRPFIMDILSFIRLSIAPFIQTHTMLKIIQPFALITAPIAPNINASTAPFTAPTILGNVVTIVILAHVAKDTTFLVFELLLPTVKLLGEYDQVLGHIFLLNVWVLFQEFCYQLFQGSVGNQSRVVQNNSCQGVCFMSSDKPLFNRFSIKR